jgi:hypothetical protein
VLEEAVVAIEVLPVDPFTALATVVETAGAAIELATGTANVAEITGTNTGEDAIDAVGCLIELFVRLSSAGFGAPTVVVLPVFLFHQ